MEKTTIIVIEDEPAHAEAISRVLTAGEEDYELLMLTKLEQYRTEIARRLPDLVIADLNLPDGKAFEIFPAVPETTKFPVLVLTAQGDEEMAVRTIKSGALDYIVKSDTTLHELPRTVKRVLREWHSIVMRKEAEEKIREGLREKETLLRELYHRTKNNMQVICAILSMQAALSDSEVVKKIIDETNSRILAMALVHQKLYQSRNLASLNLRDYFKDLVDLLVQTRRLPADRISISLDMESVPVMIDTAIPCGLVLNELISNAFKHAFPDSTGELRICLKKTDENSIEITVADNGAGVPEGFDFRKQQTLGLQIIYSVMEQQLRGKVEFASGQGITCRISFQDITHNEDS